MSLATTLTFAATFLIGAATIAPAASAQQRPDLTGRWVLDTSQTGDPSGKVAQLGRGAVPSPFDSTPTPGAGEPGVGSGRPGGGFGSGRRPGREVTEQDRERTRRGQETMERLLRGPATYEIAQSGDTISFHPLRIEEVLLRVPIDGRTWKITSAAGTIEAKAKWAQESLLLERKLPDDVKVREDFSLSMDGSRLLVDTRVNGGFGRGTLDFRRVYVREGR